MEDKKSDNTKINNKKETKEYKELKNIKTKYPIQKKLLLKIKKLMN